MLRIAEHVAGRARLHHHAAVHENNAVGNISGKRHLVGDHNHRHTVCGERPRFVLPKRFMQVPDLHQRFWCGRGCRRIGGSCGGVVLTGGLALCVRGTGQLGQEAR